MTLWWPVSANLLPERFTNSHHTYTTTTPRPFHSGTAGLPDPDAIAEVCGGRGRGLLAVKLPA